MKPYKWLRRCIDDHRPALSWGYIVTYEGKEVAITSNGYSAHLEWDTEHLPRVKVGEHILIPFEYSGTGTGWKDEVQVKPPDMVKFIEAHDVDGRETIRFIRKALLEGLERIGTKRFSPISIYVGEDNRCVLAGDRTYTEIMTGGTVSSDFPVISADTQLLRRAIPKGGLSTVEIHVERSEIPQPLIVGKWGVRCAFVMPVSVNINKKWENRRYRIAQAMLDREVTIEKGEIEF